MSRNILVITGSPRQKGNTNTLADAFIKGAEEAGNEVTKIAVGRKDIKVCIDCKYCLSHDGVCAQKDDMSDIYPLLYKHDMIVLVTPVYFFNFTAKMKALIDRLYATLVKPLPITASALLSVMTDTNEATMAPTVATYRSIADYLKWEDKGVVTAGGISEAGDIEDHEVLERAEAFGRTIE